ncbi:MAG TPA: thiamine-phosphate kinase [Propionibacteriaceae bacterium]
MRSGSHDQTLAELGEFGLIEAITAGLGDVPGLLVGPGDDGAVLELGGPVVTSVDVLVEGVHFRRDWSSAHDVGRKLVAVNVADIEAMGGRAVGLLVGFSAPADLPAAWAREFSAGVRVECATAGIALLGGDTTRARDVTVSGTVLGTLDGRAPVVRGGARPSNVVALIGRTGWAAAGLVVLGRGFRSPRAVVEVQRVPHVPYGSGAEAATAGATAMIDVSDGLLGDLGHVARASDVVIDLATAAFEVPEPLQLVAAVTSTDPMALMLTGGEDHALAATFPSAAAVPAGWRIVGQVRAVAAGEQPGILVDGAAWAGAGGYRHFRGGR